jgi:heme exporter protein D
LGIADRAKRGGAVEMNLYWSSWSDFLAMGGYGGYVWGSFGVAALALAIELLSLRARRRALSSETDQP